MSEPLPVYQYLCMSYITIFIQNKVPQKPQHNPNTRPVVNNPEHTVCQHVDNDIILLDAPHIPY